MLLVSNILIFPEVIDSSFKTVYSFIRDNRTRRRITHINDSVSSGNIIDRGAWGPSLLYCTVTAIQPLASCSA